MKKVLSIIVILFAVSNLYSQTERLDELLKHKSSDQFLSYEEGVDKSVFENHSNQILKTATFDSTSVVDSVIVTNKNGDKKNHTYIYDSNWNITLHLIEKWYGGQWVKSSRTTYVYDSNGYMILSFGDIWDGVQWVNIRRDTYTYDSNENLTLALTERWDESQWVFYSKTTYAYDPNGNWTSRIYEDWEGSQRRHTYTYDSNGNWTSWLFERLEGSQWVNSHRYTFNSDYAIGVNNFV